MKLAPVTRQAQFVGTVEAIQQVDLVARVEGFLTAIDFTEGGFVKAGDHLFEIEKDTYQAALDGAQATLEAAEATKSGAEANLKQAQVTLTRQQELKGTGDVPQSTVDQAQATRDSADSAVKQADAQIAQANAQIKTAQLNLSFTDIDAPISGRIGKAQITVGNLVSPEQRPARYDRPDRPDPGRLLDFGPRISAGCRPAEAQRRGRRRQHGAVQARASTLRRQGI